MGVSARVPNLTLRRIREEERQETRAEFVDSINKKADELKIQVAPSERYIAKLESGEVRWPQPPYRRVLTELCGRSMAQLGFIRPKAQLPGTAIVEPAAASLEAEAVPGLEQLIAAQEWPTWFGFREAGLQALVESWNGPLGEIEILQALLHEEIMMFDSAAPDHGDFGYAAYALARRQVLAAIAALPAVLGTTGRLLKGESRAPDAGRDLFLSRCAASVTACWHLLRGSDLLTVETALSSYLLPMEGLARQRSKYQRAAAVLASQAHRIFGITSLHRSNAGISERHCKKALYYADISGDLNVKAQALISLGSRYFYGSDPAQAAAVYEQASALEPSMTPLQRSRVHAELAVVYGQTKRVPEAIRSAALAEEAYPGEPEQDPSYLYAEFTPSSLTLERGLLFLAVAEQYPARGYQRKAAEVFSQMNSNALANAPDRIRFEITNVQARAAVLLDDLEAFTAHLSQGLNGAVILQSTQRQREVALALSGAVQKWPDEPRIEELGSQFKQIHSRASGRGSA